MHKFCTHRIKTYNVFNRIPDFIYNVSNVSSTYFHSLRRMRAVYGVLCTLFDLRIYAIVIAATALVSYSYYQMSKPPEFSPTRQYAYVCRTHVPTSHAN